MDRTTWTREKLLTEIASTCPEPIVAFSTGKDSIATVLALKDSGLFRRLHLAYMYLIPGLSFVEESLAYFEDLWGQRIHRLPHPSLYRWLRVALFQTPERARLLQRMGFGKIRFDYADVRDWLAQDLGLPWADTWLAVGVRACDSPRRRIAISRNGPLSRKDRIFYPVFDANKQAVLEAIQAAGIKLPIDYELFGRSVDGIDRRFLGPIKERFPADYQRILEWFPLAEAELLRYEWADERSRNATTQS